MTNQKSKMDTIGRSTTFIWILLLPLIFGFYGLSNADSTNFAKLNTFFILYVASLAALIGVTVTLLRRGGSLHADLELFWTMDVDRNGLKWILVGFVLVLLSVIILLSVSSSLSGVETRNAQIGGIGVAGAFMMLAFLRTNAILVPVAIHGMYNSLVTILQKIPLSLTPAQLSVLPKVPEVGVGILGQAADLYSELVWQFTIVAVSEEFMKLSILVAVVWVVHGIWKREPLSILSGVIISLIFWTLLHTARG